MKQPRACSFEVSVSSQLTPLQAYFDDFSRHQVHINGLQQMIQRRGGFKSLAEELLWEIAW